MNDDFEKRLQRQPLRKIPSEWREEILRVAEASTRNSKLETTNSFSTLTSRLSSILWPHPKAWAGLAALWVVIAAVHFATNDSPVEIAQKPETPSSEAVVILQQQQRLLVEIVGPVARKDIDRPKRDDVQPRSDRRLEILCT